MRQRTGRWEQTDRYTGSYSEADGQADNLRARQKDRLKEKNHADGQAVRKQGAAAAQSNNTTNLQPQN